MNNNHHSPQETLFQTCAWCNRLLSDDEEPFGFGAKANPELELRDREGDLKDALELERDVFSG